MYTDILMKMIFSLKGGGGIDRDCQKQKYCQGVKQSKVLPGSATNHGESATNESSTRECNYQNDR